MLPGIAWQTRLQTSGLHTRASAVAGDAIACAPPKPSAATVSAASDSRPVRRIILVILIPSVSVDQNRQAHSPASVQRPLMPPCAWQLALHPVGLHARACAPSAGAAIACAPPNPSAAAIAAPKSQPRMPRVTVRIAPPQVK
jgi:hypothetical protein